MVAVTSTVEPAAPAGLVAVRVVALTTLTAVAALAPNLTSVAPDKLAPVTVTEVPPAAGPWDGLTPVTAGAPGPSACTETMWLTGELTTSSLLVTVKDTARSIAEPVALAKACSIVGLEVLSTVPSPKSQR